jgi:hypothetical protein
MAPLPQENAVPQEAGVTPEPHDDDIVISGISGLLPECASYHEFIEKIYQKVNLFIINSPLTTIQCVGYMPYQIET